MKQTEKQIESLILEYLEWIPGAVFWKVDTTGVYDEKKGVYRKKKSEFRYKGVPDIIGFYRNQFVAIEVKTPQRRKQTTEDQDFFISTANEQGQLAFVATCIEDVKKAFGEKSESTIVRLD